MVKESSRVPPRAGGPLEQRTSGGNALLSGSDNGVERCGGTRFRSAPELDITDGTDGRRTLSVNIFIAHYRRTGENPAEEPALLFPSGCRRLLMRQHSS